MKTIIADINRLHWGASSNIQQIESLEEATNPSKTYIMAANQTNLSDTELIIPATQLDTANTEIGQLVYFDLELYPFFDQIKSIIEEASDRRGVFHLHRVVSSDWQPGWLVSDLYILSTLFGQPEKVWVKQTEAGQSTQHVISMVDNGGGTMAHLEYTFRKNATPKLALEWSGIGSIIEFDSDGAAPVEPAHYTASPLACSVQKLQSVTRTVSPEMQTQLSRFDQIIRNGGSPS